jgi:3-oxoacyl-[acyl-carrier protein] reductase
MTELRFDGRVAIVTGAGHGLGRQHALELAARGAKVVVNDLGGARDGTGASAGPAQEVVEEIKKNGGEAIADAGNVATVDGARALVQAALDAFGKIDIVVNNAGTSRNGAFETITDEVWREDLDQKLFAAIRLTRLVWPQMKERRWGRVINVLNIGAKAPRAGSGPTTISRAAGMALTKLLSIEGAPHNILVNAMLVGFIEADQHVQRAAKEGIPLADYIARRAKDIPLRRIGRAEEFANLACFLVSDQASYIAGTAINVDGGHSPVV